MKLVTLAFETTGVDATSDEIIEVGFQVLDTKEKLMGVESGVTVVRCMPSEKIAETMSEAVIKMHTDSGLFNDLAAGCHDVATAEQLWDKIVTQHIGPQDRPALVIWSMRMFPFVASGPWEFLARNLWQRWDFTTVSHISKANGIEPRTPERQRAGEKLDVMRETFAVWRNIGIVGRDIAAD